MIKVTVRYPNEQGKRFDLDYYTGKHVPMVGQLLESFGLVRGEVEKGISGTDPNSAPDFVVVGTLYFNTLDGVHEGFKTHGREIMGDIPNYTEIQPQIQISEILS